MVAFTIHLLFGEFAMKCTKLIRLLPLVALMIGISLSPGIVRAGSIADFENLSLSSESHWNGMDATYNNGAGDINTFRTGGMTFNNYHEYYNSSYFGCDMDYWEGWGYSNQSNTNTTVEAAGEFTAMGSGVAGHNGAGGSANYGVSYVAWNIVPTVTFDSPGRVTSASFTNTAWGYLSMLNGDSFAHKFGKADGTYPDWFLLTITGKDTGGAVTGTVDFYLADYRSTNNAGDYIIHDWTPVDLTSLGDNVKSLEFGLTSSDTGDWGMNTPSYLAMDNLSFSTVPEPSTLFLLLGASITGAAWRFRRWLRPQASIGATSIH
jgi:hypothetical protein